MVSAAEAAAVVAVPVRNEGVRLRRLFAVLAEQRDPPPFALCVFLDACTDDSHAVVTDMATALPYPVVAIAGPDSAPNAGRARAAAAALASAHAPGAALLTTDADSEPGPHWVAASLAALGHADLVAGRILLDDPAAAPTQSRLVRYYDRVHALRRVIDPVGWEEAESHHWTSGASLAFRPEVYRALGGFAPLASGEDADIADRAWRSGYRVRRDAAVTVRTSTRRHGRVPDGFGAGLARMEAAADLPLVSHPDDEQWRFVRHAEARRAFAAGEPWRCAASLGADPAALGTIAAQARNADAFAACAVGDPPGGMRQVSLAHAEALLDVAAGELDDVA
jgi:hypothetical protein